MSIAAEIQELTQNTAELNGIRTDIRTALAGKGVTADTHNYSDFAADITAIPSGGGDGLIVPLNLTEFLTPEITTITSALGQTYNSAVTYYTSSAATTEADMSSYSNGDTITDTVYFYN